MALTELPHGPCAREHQERFASVLAPPTLEPRRRQPDGRRGRVLVVQWEHGGPDAARERRCALERPRSRDLQHGVTNGQSCMLAALIAQAAYLRHKLVRESEILRERANGCLLDRIVPALNGTRKQHPMSIKSRRNKAALALTRDRPR